MQDALNELNRTTPGNGLLRTIFNKIRARTSTGRPRLPAPRDADELPSHAISFSRDEARIAAIWADLLRIDHLGLDDDFFELGGHSLLVVRLQRRIVEECGVRVSVPELYRNSTVRRQAQILNRSMSDAPVLPDGVHPLQPYGTREGIFWVHLVERDLASALGTEHPLFSLVLTAADLASLGGSPSAREVATCLARKILDFQPDTPHILGGLCVNAVIAFETASQLQSAGHKVSLLVLVDPPRPTHLESFTSLCRGLSYGLYCLQRAQRLGLAKAIAYAGEHLRNGLARIAQSKSPKTDLLAAHQTIRTAVRSYRPESYDGHVLLTLPTERPSYEGLFPGWHSVVPRHLHTLYLEGNHRELLHPTNARKVAANMLQLLRSDSLRPTLSEDADGSLDRVS